MERHLPRRGAAHRSADDELAKEGYQFYASEALEFAESSAKAVAEALDDTQASAWDTAIGIAEPLKPSRTPGVEA